MKAFLSGLAVLALSAAAARADDKAPAKGAKEQLQAILGDVRNEVKAAVKSIKDVPEGASEAAMHREIGKIIDRVAPRFLAVAKESADDEVSLQALMIVALEGGDGGQPSAQARDLLVKRYAGKVVKLGGFDQANGRNGELLLRAVADGAPSPDTKRAALLALAQMFKTQSETVAVGGEAAALEKASEARKLLRAVRPEFASDPAQAKAVERSLWELDNLAVGRPAPEVESEGLDGKKVKLSALKGKVVVLDIWATWCPPCKAMIPHERELVKRLAGKPFVLVSVSADDEVATLKEFIKGEPMPWTHWYNGPKGLVETWGVQFFPTIYVIDAKGVVRYRGTRGEDMDKAVELLLKEA